MASCSVESYYNLYFKINHLLKNISGFFPPFHNYSTNCIHLNLIMFAFSFFGSFQFIKSHIKGFIQSSESYSVVVITIELYSKVLKAGNEFPWWFFSPFFSFLLVGVIVCVKQQKAFLKASQFLTCLESVSLGYRWPIKSIKS